MKNKILSKFSSLKMRRRSALVLTIVLIATIITAGTLAWVSLNQAAKNETSGDSRPGGRLHDDFDGENKDVYAENYSTAPLLVRIRLDEHYEYGSGAGLKTGEPGYDTKAVTILTKDSDGNPSDINDVNTWQTHIPFSTNPAFCPDELHSYFTWIMGGQKDYLPTFNKDNTDLSTDVTGIAIDGVTGNTNTAPGTGVAPNPDNDGSHAYWTAGDTLTSNADYGAGTVVSEEHTVQPTLNATVVSMADWLDPAKYDRASGPYWVYDTDGWAYWAQALEPGTATGLLLDEINAFMGSKGSYYYGINVVGQFADLSDYTAFYDEDNGAAVQPGSGADYLLRQNTNNNPKVHAIDITPNPVPDFVINITDEVDFDAILSGYNLSNYDESGVTWTIEPGHGGVFDPVTGKLTGAQNVGEYTVTATSKDDPTKSASVVIKIKDSVEYIEPYNAFGLGTQNTYDNLRSIQYAQSVILDGYAYTFAGWNGSTYHVGSYKYNLSTGEITQIADFPHPATNPMPIVVGDKIYIAGGATGTSTLAYGDVYEYDPAANTYTTKVNDNTELSQSNYGGVLGYNDGCIYVIGGGDRAYGTFTDHILKIDMSTWSVTTLTVTAPVEASLQGAVQVGNVLYVGDRFQGFFAFDMETETVTSLADLPLTVYQAHLAWNDSMGKIVLLESAGYVYNIATDSWTADPEFNWFSYSSDGMSQSGDVLFGFGAKKVYVTSFITEPAQIAVANQDETFMIKAETYTDKAVTSEDGSVTYNPGDIIPANTTVKALEDDTKISLNENLIATGSWVKRME